MDLTNASQPRRPEEIYTLSFHELRLVSCCDSELTSETTNPFRHLGRILWVGYRPITNPLPTQDSTPQRKAERDSNPRSQFGWSKTYAP